MYQRPIRTDRELLEEVADRSRRTETRLTRFLEGQGMDVGSQRPRWVNGRIEAPSGDVSSRDLIAVVPRDWPREDLVDVYIKQDFLMAICLEPGD